MKVLVCVWEPKHTLVRLLRQRKAKSDGTIARLVEEHGTGTDALRAALLRAKLLTHMVTIHGDKTCPDCGSLMEEVDGPDGIDDPVEAVRDVAHDFDAALTRTRAARA